MTILNFLKIRKTFFKGLFFLFAVLPSVVSAATQPSPSVFISPGNNPFVKIPNLLQGTQGPAGQLTFGGVVLIILQVALLIVGSVAVISLIWGGFRYLTAYGNEEQAESAKRVLKQAVLGFLIVLLSFAIISIITNIVISRKVSP